MNQSIPLLFAVALIFSPSSTALAKNIGGLKSGDRFELKVSRVDSTQKVGIAGPTTVVPIPAGVPRYIKNRSITFRIRGAGLLSAPGLNLPFSHYTKGVAEFNLFRQGTVSVSQNAEIKVRGGRVGGGTLSFFITDSSGLDTIYRTVIVKLVKP